MSPSSPDASNRSGSVNVPAAMSSPGKRHRRPGDALPPQTAADAGDESVASLVRRLGTPPPDLAAQLARRFHDACRQRLADGEPIAAIDLEDWTINRHGDLVYTGNPPAADQATRDLEALTAQFQQQLSVPRPAIARRRSSNRSRIRVDRVPFESDNHVDQQAAVAKQSLALSSIEQARREKLIERFTASLADRFGEASLAPPEVNEERIRHSKPQPIARDRRFNWNLVLGVGSAAIAIALIGTAIRINQIRSQRAENRARQTPTVKQPVTSSDGQRPGPAEPAHVFEATTPPTAQVAEPETSRTPHVVPSPSIDRQDGQANEAAKLLFTADSIIERQRHRGGFDVMDDLDDLVASSVAGDPMDKPDSAVAIAIDPLKTPEIERPSRSSSFTFSKDETAGETLESVLSAETSEQDVAEVSQQTRPSNDRFVQLPRSGDSESETVIAPSTPPIERIEFPSPVSIALSGAQTDDTRDLINQTNGNPIAQLIRTGPDTLFRWSDDAARDGLSQKLLHGRMALSGGDSVYLRPSIETDPYPISLAPSQWRPSWPLGAPLLPSVSRLEIDLSVPDSIDLAWHTPFDPARPHHGSAIAILTPTDGETVAIAVRLDIDCSRRLSCRLILGRRLDPALDWMKLSQASFAAEQASLTEHHRKLQMQRGLFEQRYSSANQMERRMMRKSRDSLDAAIERSEVILERLKLLEELASATQQHVKLHLHAFVQWPDAAQTLLRTTNPDAVP
ncbi:hypothetical protein Enr13x_34910 [Stieleria neptunia]|uniref:Transmembrane protein n=1 Tax=Stieleria neptunia TaxID=2527979 RepID=A0A518HS37_9BACT|nr:hypothetical protein [Stieleria neptunia]QDV43634.1 hypothetical protein Enr13x_34910 [Stieleria neptunia]